MSAKTLDASVSKIMIPDIIQNSAATQKVTPLSTGFFMNRKKVNNFGTRSRHAAIILIEH
jgi:hypothetical protein